VKNANLVSGCLGAAALALFSLGVAGCGTGKPEGAASAAKKTVFDHFTIDVGGHPASLQVAVLGPEQERGLMERPDLGGDDGMIFVNPSPRKLGIWMHDTPEPLDLGYLARDGTIVEMYDLLPMDERVVTSHSDDVQFALEMPKGWFARNGIRPGARVDMKGLADALEARGFDPVVFRIRERQLAP